MTDIVIQIREINTPAVVIAEDCIGAFYPTKDREQCALQLIDQHTTLQARDCFAVVREVLNHVPLRLGKDAIQKIYF